MTDGIDSPTRWPSLHDECQLAERLFGDTGFGKMADWLRGEVDRIDDTAFAKTFSDHIALPGIVTGDFNHRLIRTSRGDLLGGIRFYGRDIARPFVEIICHNFADTADLADCVHAEWSAFATRFARVYTRPGALTGPTVVLDHTVHAARCADMAPPDGRVRLIAFDDADAAVDLVLARYARVSAENPQLARNLTAEDPDGIRAWHADGQLKAVSAGDRIVGAFAAVPGQVRWIDGYEVYEEVISSEFAGHGYAASTQAAWAHSAADPDRLLLGTIDRLNPASRRSAERAGRPALLDAVFLRLTGT